MVFTAYVADLDLSYDSNRLVISAFGVGYTIYENKCNLVPQCIACLNGTYCDGCPTDQTYSVTFGVGCVAC